MRKTYIGWWIAAGVFFLMAMESVYQGNFNPYVDTTMQTGLYGLFAIILGFSGYSRYKAYKEYQHDRAVRNQFYESNQNIAGNQTQFVKVTHFVVDEPEIQDAETREVETKEAERLPEPEKETTEKKREGTVKREFSVAGVSRHQDVFEKAGYLNDEYSLSVKRLEEEGLLYDDIPKYNFGTVDLRLELDPDNEVDPNAVKVFLNDEHVGFIPAEDAEYVHDMMEADRIADMDGRIVGGPLKRYDEIEEKMVKVDLTFGIRIDLYVRKGR